MQLVLFVALNYVTVCFVQSPTVQSISTVLNLMVSPSTTSYDHATPLPTQGFGVEVKTSQASLLPFRVSAHGKGKKREPGIEVS